MSGALGLGAIAPGVLDGATGGNLLSSLLGDVLDTAGFRGVAFMMPDTRRAVGRRVVEIYFPGQDAPKYQDFGKLNGHIDVTGIIAGDDYAVQATRIEKALSASGPGTLIHPWYGTLQARVMPGATVSMADHEQRFVRFTASFSVVPPSASKKGVFASITDTLTHAISQADAIVDNVVLTGEQLLSPIVLPLALTSAVSSWFSQAQGVWTAVTGYGVSTTGTAQAYAPDTVQTAMAPAMAVLAAGVPQPAQNLDTSWANAVTDALAGVPSAICAAITDPNQPAVAPASLVANGAQATLDGATVVSILLAAAVQTGAAGDALAQISGDPDAVLTLAVMSRSLIMSQAIAAQGAVTYASGADAIAARNALTGALDALMDDLTACAASGAPVDLSGLMESVLSAKAAVIADISSQIGRLPKVVSVTVRAATSAWAIAYAVAGDDVSVVQAAYDDMVARNDLATPGLAGPGVLQVLEPLT